jgi:hypothetical protein
VTLSLSLRRIKLNQCTRNFLLYEFIRKQNYTVTRQVSVWLCHISELDLYNTVGRTSTTWTTSKYFNVRMAKFVVLIRHDMLKIVQMLIPFTPTHSATRPYWKVFVVFNVLSGGHIYKSASEQMYTTALSIKGSYVGPCLHGMAHLWFAGGGTTTRYGR